MNDTTHELGELGATSPGEPRWQPLQRADLIALVAAMAVATFLVMSRTVWAPCLDDPGEMQVAAAVGGIGHPPGHAGIVTLFRAFCLLSPMPPHLTVSFVNALFALITCLILFVLMIRTGVHALFASLCTLMLLADDQFWHAAITPEPYATCFALLGGSLWCFFSWLNKRTPWRFWLAMFLLAYVMANRAPTAAFAAAFGAVLLIDARARQAWETTRLRKLALLVAIGLVPVAIIVASLWLRDVPQNPYNYLDRAWLSLRDYPPDNDTASEKWSRLWWLVSAKQYDYMFHPTWRTVTGQARWLLTELGFLRGPFLWPLSVAGLAIIVLGTFTLFRQNRSIAIFVIIMIPAAVMPILLVRVVSHTAMLPNLLFPLLWLLGIGLSRVASWGRSPICYAALVALASVPHWLIGYESLYARQDRYDARLFIRQVDLESLPPNAMLITSFDAVALVYAQQVFGLRPDVEIVNQYGRLNRPFLESVDRPIFTTESLPSSCNADLIGEGIAREIRLRPPAGAGGVADNGCSHGAFLHESVVSHRVRDQRQAGSAQPASRREAP